MFFLRNQRAPLTLRPLPQGEEAIRRKYALHVLREKGGHAGWGPGECNNRLEIEAITQDHFYDEVIGAGSHPNSHAKVELPIGGEFQVNGWEELVLLVP